MSGSSCLHFYTRTYTAQMLVHMPVVCSIVLGLIFSFSRVFHNIRSVYLTSFVYNVVSSTTFLASHEMSVDARAAQNPAWHWQWDEEGQNIGHHYYERNRGKIIRKMNHWYIITRLIVKSKSILSSLISAWLW